MLTILKNYLKKYLVEIISVMLALGIGGASAWFTRRDMNAFKVVNKPVLTPPNSVFPVVWGILFILMGISSARIYRIATLGKQLEEQEENQSEDSIKREARKSLVVYALSLVFNFWWSIIFFHFRAYLFAWIWLIVLLILIGITIWKYRPLDSMAAYLQIPYFLWVLFAGYINLGVYVLSVK